MNFNKYVTIDSPNATLEPLPVMFDTSQPGSGKSYSVAEFLKSLKINSFWSETTRVVLLTPSPKHFDQDNFSNFLIVEGRRSDEINPETKKIVRKANCIYAEQANILVSKGHSANILCRSECGNSSNCVFKQTRSQSTLAKGIITTAASYEAIDGDILFIDEGTQNIPLTVTINISKQDLILSLNFVKKIKTTLLSKRSRQKIKDLIEIIDLTIRCMQDLETQEIICLRDEESRNILRPVFEKFNKCTLSKNFIESIKRVFITEELLEKVSAPNEIPRNFLSHFYDFLNGKSYGISIYIDSNFNPGINLQVINPTWVDIVRNIKNFTIVMLVILDATPDELLFKYLKSEGIEYVINDFSIKKSETKITQITDYMFSRSAGKLNQKFQGLIKKLAKEREGLIGIICFQDKIHELQKILKELKLEHKFKIGYWGCHNRGTNIFSKCNTLILVGRYIFSPIQAEMIAMALRDNINIEESDGGKLLVYPQTNKAIYRKYFDQLLRDFHLRETKQGIGRINRIGINEQSQFEQIPEVYLLTNEPMDFEVDDLIRFEDILDFNETISEEELERRSALKLTNEEVNNRCEKAYKYLKSIDKKPTRDELRKQAGISNNYATEFLRSKKSPD